MNSCSFLILLGGFILDSLDFLLVFRVGVKAELFLIAGSVDLFWLTSVKHDRNEIIKNYFESGSNGIGNKIEESIRSLSNLWILLSHQYLIDLLHSSHYVSLIECHMIRVFNFAEDIG